jgi:hypothetical protein
VVAVFRQNTGLWVTVTPSDFTIFVLSSNWQTRIFALFEDMTILSPESSFILLNKLLPAFTQVKEQDGCRMIQLFVLMGVFINLEGTVNGNH